MSVVVSGGEVGGGLGREGQESKRTIGESGVSRRRSAFYKVDAASKTLRISSVQTRARGEGSGQVFFAGVCLCVTEGGRDFCYTLLYFDS